MAHPQTSLARRIEIEKITYFYIDWEYLKNAPSFLEVIMDPYRPGHSDKTQMEIPDPSMRPIGEPSQVHEDVVAEFRMRAMEEKISALESQVKALSDEIVNHHHSFVDRLI